MSSPKHSPDGVPVDPRSKRQRLAAIERQPSAYQVCEGCDSIVSTRASVCPHCHAYRFDGDAKRVVATARRIVRRAGKPLP